MATRAEREQEEADREKADRDMQNKRQGQVDPVTAEHQRAADQAAKAQHAYIDEMNRKIADVVNSAGHMKDKDPQLLNHTAQALRDAAAQLEAAQRGVA